MLLTKNKSKLDIRVQDAYDLMLSLPAGSVDLVLTDPPYGITDCLWDKELCFDSFWQGIHHCTKTNAAIVVFGSNKFTIKLAASNLKDYRYRFVWDKSNGVVTNPMNSHKMPMFAFEDILVFYRKLPTYNYQDCMRFGFKPYVRKGGPRLLSKVLGGGFYAHGSKKTLMRQSINGERFPINVLKFNKDNHGSGKHASVKPMAMVEYLIRMYSNAGELVLDPFLGSGTTAKACINTERNFVGGDLSQEFFDQSVKAIIESLL